MPLGAGSAPTPAGPWSCDIRRSAISRNPGMTGTRPWSSSDLPCSYQPRYLIFDINNDAAAPGVSGARRGGQWSRAGFDRTFWRAIGFTVIGARRPPGCCAARSRRNRRGQGNKAGRRGMLGEVTPRRPRLTRAGQHRDWPVASAHTGAAGACVEVAPAARGRGDQGQAQPAHRQIVHVLLAGLGRHRGTSGPRPRAARVGDRDAGHAAARAGPTSTVKKPPHPESVCTTAFADSSDTQVIRASRAGCSASRQATNRRTSATCAFLCR